MNKLNTKKQLSVQKSGKVVSPAKNSRTAAPQPLIKTAAQKSATIVPATKIKPLAPKNSKAQIVQPKRKIKTIAAQPPLKNKKNNSVVAPVAKKTSAVKKPLSANKTTAKNTANRTVKPNVKAVAPSKIIKSKTERVRKSVAPKVNKIVGGRSKIAAAKPSKAKTTASKIAPAISKKRVTKVAVKPSKIVAVKTKKVASKVEQPKSKTTAATKKPQVAAIGIPRKIAAIKPPAKKIKPSVTAKKVKRENGKIKKTAAKPQAIKATKFVVVAKTKQKIATAKMPPVKKVEAAIQPPEIAAPKVRVKPKNKKAKPISSAVFRGVKQRYDFQVFALTENFEPIQAVYVISKRKTDKKKRAHHALICIGATDSIADEIKKNRKNYLRKYAANVISILPEENEQKRLKIETDLKAAHPFLSVNG